MWRAKILRVSIGIAVLALSVSMTHTFFDEFIRWIRSKLRTSTTHVVIIGIDSYDNHSDLSYAVGDALDMAELFKLMGYSVPPDQILTRSRPKEPHITSDIIQQTVLRVMRKASSEDRVIVFYAGHGAEVTYKEEEKEAYLLPSDFQQDRVAISGLAFRDLVKLARLDEIKAKHVVFFLDACYAADALRIEALRTAEFSDPLDEAYYQKLLDEPAIVVMTAGSQGQRVREVGGNGVFTAALMQGLAGEADLDGNGVIRFFELDTWLGPRVFSDSKNNEQIVKAGRIADGIGEPVFLVPPAEVRIGVLGQSASKQLDARLAKQRSQLNSRGTTRVTPDLYDAILKGVNTNTGRVDSAEGLRLESSAHWPYRDTDNVSQEREDLTAFSWTESYDHTDLELARDIAETRALGKVCSAIKTAWIALEPRRVTKTRTCRITPRLIETGIVDEDNKTVTVRVWISRQSLATMLVAG